jgi:hypothetical protein
VVVGAFIFTTLPEVLRNVVLAGFLFYLGGLAALAWWLKSTRLLIAILGGTFLGGLLLKLVVNLLWPGFDVGVVPAAGSFLNQWVQNWLIIPADYKTVGNIMIGGAILALLLTLLAKAPWRWLILGLSIYMFAFAWETRLATEPSVTRILVVGGTLIVLMIIRPQGLFGELRVTVV